MADSSAILGAKILIVDDQPASVRALEAMLHEAGYSRVGSTTNPAAVAALHRRNNYDLIVLDLMMPALDGFGVMDALKKIERGGYVPVLALTGEPRHKVRALQAGARDFISKPFDRAEALTRIRNLLEVRLLHREAADQRARLEQEVRERTAELSKSEEMFRELAANIPAALWIRDVEQHTIRYANPAWKALTGRSPSVGAPLESAYDAIHPDDLQWLTHERRRTNGAATSSEYRIVRPDESVRWVHARTFPITNPAGGAPWLVEFIDDITQRREAQTQLLHLARHDALTDLPNRMLLYEALREALVRAGSDGLAVSVLLLDIDEFKSINDTLGHAAGDALLREFAARLAACVRPGDTVGRLGGDEFAVIVPAPANGNGAIEVADRIHHALQTPLVLEGREISVTSSIGIASYPADTTDLETLIRYADAAMYEAKAAGRNMFRCYSAEMSTRAMKRSDIAGALRFAQGRDEFLLHYQPKIHIDSGRCVGVEALLRWNRPGHGLVPPAQFVPALEEMGLIVPVGSWVIDTACRQICEWEAAGLGRIRIAVNVSARQVRDERFASVVSDLVHEHGIDPRLLELEVTESTLMAHGDASDAALRRLRALGISLAVDDFGTGFSNLARLKRFPIAGVKIDIGFTRDVMSDPDDASITVAIINMAHSLRLKVVAEGVETREQFEFLRVHGCDEVQGYLLSKPLPADEMSAVLCRMNRGGPHLVLHDSRRSAANA